MKTPAPRPGAPAFGLPGPAPSCTMSIVILRAPTAPRSRTVAAVGVAVAVAAMLTVAACTSSPDTPRSSAPRSANKAIRSASPAEPATVAPSTLTPATVAALRGVVRSTMADRHLRAAIVSVTVDGRPVLTQAWGESMAGVPATTAMHFRNGAVAIAYMSTLLLEQVDRHRVRLTDRLSRWLPDVPHSRDVTLAQLAQMTAGYVDYVTLPQLDPTLYADPFTPLTDVTKLRWAATLPLLYRPGTNWNYSHTDYVLLGMALAKITGKPLERALRQDVLDPLHLRDTDDPGTPEIPSRCCTPTPRSAGTFWGSRPGRDSSRTRPSGTRPGPWRKARSSTPTSTT